MEKNSAESTGRSREGTGSDSESVSEELVRRARDGDRDAWDALFALASDGLRWRVEARMGRGVRGAIEVDDVLQEACLKAYRARDGFQWQGMERFVGWLSTFSGYAIREAARKHRRPVGLLEEEIAGDESPPSRGPRRQERFDRLLRAYELLSPDHRKVLRLVRLEGLTVSQVARRMNRSESAVRHLVLRALRSLRELFGEPTGSLHLPSEQLDTDESFPDTEVDGSER